MYTLDFRVNSDKCTYCIFYRIEDVYENENTSCATWCAKGYEFSGCYHNPCPDYVKQPKYKYTQIVYAKKWDHKLQKYVDDPKEREFKKALIKVHIGNQLPISV